MLLIYVQEICLRIIYSCLGSLCVIYLLEQYEEIVIYLVVQKCSIFFEQLFDGTPVMIKSVLDIEVILDKISFGVSVSLFLYLCSIHVVLFCIPLFRQAVLKLGIIVLFVICVITISYVYIFYSMGDIFFLQIYNFFLIEYFEIVCQFSILDYFKIFLYFFEVYIIGMSSFFLLIVVSFFYKIKNIVSVRKIFNWWVLVLGVYLSFFCVFFIWFLVFCCILFLKEVIIFMFS